MKVGIDNADELMKSSKLQTHRCLLSGYKPVRHCGLRT